VFNPELAGSVISNPGAKSSSLTWLDRAERDVLVSVRNLEAVDGTPILDVKPVLGPIDER
jgi:tRNA (Thr-GGU) A37 N-methylase